VVLSSKKKHRDNFILFTGKNHFEVSEDYNGT